MLARPRPGQTQAQAQATPSHASVALAKPSLSLAQAKAIALVPSLGPRANLIFDYKQLGWSVCDTKTIVFAVRSLDQISCIPPNAT